MKTLGLCIGSSNISLVILEQIPDRVRIERIEIKAHEGDPGGTIRKMLDNKLLPQIKGLAITGRKLKAKLQASSLAEPEAVEYAYEYLREQYPKVDVIVSAGGETFMAYKLDSKGRIVNVFTGNKCASGTGEFFLQQIKRMDLKLEEAVNGTQSANPYQLAGRCSVFCKSDCTHALNKGRQKEEVVAGLSRMLAVKIMEILNKTEYQKVMLIGGVSANPAVVGFLQKEIPELCIPPEAKYFEALGAALWAQKVKTKSITAVEELLAQAGTSFACLPDLKDALPLVTYKETLRQEVKAGDLGILGLDVGSTTTKAVLIRSADQAILAGCYLRTNGDPVEAARKCYREINGLLKTTNIKIVGLGVTGSGRQIAALHGGSKAVINEIIAHAAAAVYFDPKVDTIFEIGGQDAKYTFITNGVASDYAMNEACSAGTGSFLEEAAQESLAIPTQLIGEIALKSANPLDFNDQCAAFIGSDIKSAIQEGRSVEDVAAGLVYSICQNYINRVKGNRTVGQRVFMQGGVCYNKAVPLAMAGLIGKGIIVPPEPGLMGAFGVALEVQNRLDRGLLEAMDINLEELAARELHYADPFTCRGGQEQCDRKCRISRLSIGGRTYPFGGSCNRYVNLIRDQEQISPQALDLVRQREKMLTETYTGRKEGLLPAHSKTVGINYSLMTHTLFPLYDQFFHSLGFQVILGTEIDSQGIKRRGAEFCYPVEIAHGALQGLIKTDADFYFLPFIKALPAVNLLAASVTCPMVQAEPYYLKATFPEIEAKILSPILDFSKGYASGLTTFLNLAKTLGVRKEAVKKAFSRGVEAQEGFTQQCQEMGGEFLQALDRQPEKIAIVLFGRSYNAFTASANMGIPQKFVSRGYSVIPHEFLPFSREKPEDYMYWANGQKILQGAKYVQRHPRLFPVFITNFSCGADSFLINYFRKIMGNKPSLTLELDSHTADAGLDTRIEAFLDVVNSYLKGNARTEPPKSGFRAAEVVSDAQGSWVMDSQGRRFELTDPKVHVLFPSIGDFAIQLFAAAFRRMGIKASHVPAPAERELKIGKGLSSCKECLPLTLTVGSLVNYLENRGEKEEILVYFMPTTSGPCRFGQYSVFIKNLIEKMQLQDVALLSLTSENSYAGFGTQLSLRLWQSIVISDVMEDIYSAVLTVAKDQAKALAAYALACQSILQSVEKDDWQGVKRVLREAAARLGRIERVQELEQVPKVSLVGEIYVRRDGFSRQYLVERLAREGIMVRTAPVSEWLHYCDYNIIHKIVKTTLKERMATVLIHQMKRFYEREIKQILGQSGLYQIHLIEIEEMLQTVSQLISPEFETEALLTTAAAFYEAVEDAAGVISIGPFACMLSRIAESVITAKMSATKIKVARNKELVAEVMKHHPSIPHLAVETDGNPFPQLIEARFEVFGMQVKRVHQRTMAVKELKGKGG
ncbi:acyl-CoA dehydratase activase [Desulfosporosinus youngiae]|uniref:CoA-substrate-specific enzyme activase, putative n=1 Tax=Desulfosporosinus youngiae DSM 17734 TaxID=768710 RepID=H5Y3D5_9FIRM|nr:acyl-CoA dehydratase activase [Desulfosporosinus youngiae]EHQ88904.1 CoA-substrate-specific enzyme activase, putative [Desulfosporosinus youngiae DSM 17734]